MASHVNLQILAIAVQEIAWSRGQLRYQLINLRIVLEAEKYRHVALAAVVVGRCSTVTLVFGYF